MGNCPICMVVSLGISYSFFAVWRAHLPELFSQVCLLWLWFWLSPPPWIIQTATPTPSGSWFIQCYYQNTFKWWTISPEKGPNRGTQMMGFFLSRDPPQPIQSLVYAFTPCTLCVWLSHIHQGKGFRISLQQQIFHRYHDYVIYIYIYIYIYI